MEVPNQPPIAGNVRKKQSQTKASLQWWSKVEHACHLPWVTELLYYNLLILKNFPLNKVFLSSGLCMALCQIQDIREEAGITLCISGPTLEEEIKYIHR